MKKLKTQRTSWHQIARYLAAASKRLATARRILSIDEEACFQQTYDAMLKASLGFMLSSGYDHAASQGIMSPSFSLSRRTWTNSTMA